MAAPPWTPAEITRIRELFPSARSPRDMVVDFPGRSVAAISQKCRDLGLLFSVNRAVRSTNARRAPVQLETVPSATRTVEEMLSDLERDFDRKELHNRTKSEGILITLPEDGPFAVLFFGDPHIGDPGCDIRKLKSDVRTVANEPYVYGANIGDLANFWVGKLGRLYAHQALTDDEEIKLAEWLVSEVPWLMLILGNHDKWGPVAELLCKRHGRPYMGHGGVIRIASGDAVFTVAMRHQWRGGSQYDPAFGEGKAHFRGLQADLIIGGHTHQGAESSRTNGTSGVTARLVNLGAYKKYDEYADQKGFSPDTNGPSCLAVFDPELNESDPNRCTVFWNIERGLTYLDALRAKWGSR